MDPMYREQLKYSLQRSLENIFNGYASDRYIEDHLPVNLCRDTIDQNLTTLGPDDFLSQALRYYLHCTLHLDDYRHKRRPRSKIEWEIRKKEEQHERRRKVEIVHRLDDKYGEFLKRRNLLEYTARKNWLDEFLETTSEGAMQLSSPNSHVNPATETFNDNYRNKLKYTIESELTELTGVEIKSRPKDLELITFSPATIERSFSALEPFDYEELYSLHYILLRQYSGDRNMTHEEADREAQSRLDEYKAEHFERMCEESRELSECMQSPTWSDGSEGDGSESDGSEGDGSESDGSQSPAGSDGATSLASMDIDLPEPTDEELTTKISALEISGKESNGEPHGLTQTAKKRHFDDKDATDDAFASGSKRARTAYY
ncbi:hypothetical protein F53441_11360 [Fusarium austroafricanum]|uniref:Uncharacterized protein n=1 Tax=Fusarium austroafricanum TaxID=2364996 RepID=A0A8H4K4X1_9HYPO|nr:hypothetical protein F53441_11360 [Fusarium austroafricanum]